MPLNAVLEESGVGIGLVASEFINSLNPVACLLSNLNESLDFPLLLFTFQGEQYVGWSLTRLLSKQNET